MQHTANQTEGVLGRSSAFAIVFVLMFGLTFAFLAAVGATPDAPSTKPIQTQVVATSTAPEQPVRITAAAIGLDTVVANPASTDIEVLDKDLLKGAVRYPTSALLGQEGTMIIFGHSSYLPIVHNQAYKTFDGIQDLKTGAVVSLYSGSLEYRYAVTSVRVADATTDAIEMVKTGKHLVLVTCDSFASKSNRFVVTLDLVGTYALGN